MIFDQGNDVEMEIRHFDADGMILDPDVLVACALANRFFQLQIGFVGNQPDVRPHPAERRKVYRR